MVFAVWRMVDLTVLLYPFSKILTGLRWRSEVAAGTTGDSTRSVRQKQLCQPGIVAVRGEEGRYIEQSWDEDSRVAVPQGRLCARANDSQCRCTLRAKNGGDPRSRVYKEE